MLNAGSDVPPYIGLNNYIRNKTVGTIQYSLTLTHCLVLSGGRRTHIYIYGAQKIVFNKKKKSVYIILFLSFQKYDKYN